MLLELVLGPVLAPAITYETAWLQLLDDRAQAKAAARAAFDAWRAAEAALWACPEWVRRCRVQRQPVPCECHAPAVVDSYEAYQEAKAAIEVTVDRIKAGVDADQLLEDVS